MTDKQPEALRLAELLETDGLNPASTVRQDAAAELRRLHAHNAELLAALRGLLADTQHAEHDCGDEMYCPVHAARVAIAHAEEQA